jgi:hypothetical protein
MTIVTCSVVGAQQKPESRGKTYEQAAKKFVELLDNGEFAKATNAFDAEVLKAMPAEELKKTWETIVSKAGAFKRQLGARSGKSGEHELVDVQCEFAKAKIDVRVVFNKEGKIGGLFFVPVKEPTPPGADETLAGALKLGPANLRLVVHLFKQKDGSYAGTLDSPDQGAAGIKFDEVIVKGDDVRLEIKSLTVVFEGKREKDGRITGQFKQGGQSFPLVLTKAVSATKSEQSKPAGSPAKP